VVPQDRDRFMELYDEWKRARHTFSQLT